MPSLTRVAVLRDAALASGIGQFAVIQSVASSLRVETSAIDVRDTGEIESRHRGLCAHRHWWVDLDIKRAGGGSPQPDHHAGRPAQAAGDLLSARLRRRRGGLISYGYDVVDQYRRSGGYVDRILKGESRRSAGARADASTSSSSTSRPPRRSASRCRPTLLARADEVIE